MVFILTLLTTISSGRCRTHSPEYRSHQNGISKISIAARDAIKLRETGHINGPIEGHSEIFSHLDCIPDNLDHFVAEPTPNGIFCAHISPRDVWLRRSRCWRGADSELKTKHGVHYRTGSISQPGHSGMIGNCKTDELVRKGTVTQTLARWERAGFI